MSSLSAEQAALRAAHAALQEQCRALRADRDAVTARSLAAMAAADAAAGARDAELEGARRAAEAAIGALGEAQGECAALRAALRAAEAEAAARGEHEAEVLRLLAAAQAEAAGARGDYGDKLLLASQVAHLQLDCGRLLALLRRTREYGEAAAALAPSARAAAVAAAGASAGGEDAAADAPPGGYLRSTYVGALPGGLPGSGRYLGGLPPGARLPPQPPGGAASLFSRDRRWDALSGLEEAYGGYAASVEACMASLGEGGGGGEGDSGARLDTALEVASWIPADAAALCAAFRQRYLLHVDVEDVRAFLVGLQIAWSARCEELVAGSRVALLKKCKEYRRALAQRMPYREVMQASTIVRINQELVTMRHRQGVTGGIPNPAIPIRDHEEHGVAFGRTVGGGSGGAGGGGGGASGATLRSLSPVRAFLSSVHRGESVGGGSGGGAQHTAARGAWAGGEEEGGAEEADAAAALLGGALKDAAARLRHSHTLPLTTTGALAALPVSLTRVPGSGARRLDALETAQLLESALAAVDDLGGANRALRARVRELEGEVRDALADAAEEERLRESVGGVGGGGRQRGGGTSEEQQQQQQRHQQLLQGSFASRVTATLGGSFAGGRPSSGGAGGSAAAAAASSASASSSGAAMAARLLYPPPPPPPARSTSAASHQRQQQQQQSHPDLPPLGESGAFSLPFRAPPAAAQRRFPAQGGSGSPVRATPSATAAAAQAQAQFSQAQQYAQPSPQQQQHYYQQQQQQQQHPQAPFVSRPSGDSFSGAQSLPARPRRLSVGDAVRAAVGAASMVASR